MEESSELIDIMKNLSDEEADRIIAFALALMREQKQVARAC
jgi:hypothetical protein